MWLFTRGSFISAVQKSGTDCITVRARIKMDLDNLRKDFMPALSETIAYAGSDYPFRSTISKNDFSEGLKAIALDIDYDNFKGVVGETSGLQREFIYSKVWATLLELEALDG